MFKLENRSLALPKKAFEKKGKVIKKKHAVSINDSFENDLCKFYPEGDEVNELMNDDFDLSEYV